MGGKSNTKIMHLVNWKVVRAPNTHNGLGILYPNQSNLVLGEKILWRLVTGKKDWWKKVMLHNTCVETGLGAWILHHQDILVLQYKNS
jgi:hypothetical protein